MNLSLGHGYQHDCLPGPPEPMLIQEGPYPSSQKQHESLTVHYQTIGEVLMIAEASLFRVGIPWLPPNAHVRALRKKYESPLDDFIRMSLVTVPTKSLEAYSEDLEPSDLKPASNEELMIRTPGFLERFSLALLLCKATFLLCSATLFYVEGGTPAAWFLVIFASLTAGAAAAFASLENQRRISLHVLIFREILRRKGLDPSNSNGLNLVSLET